MNVPSESWLEKRFVPAALVAVASAASLAYLGRPRVPVRHALLLTGVTLLLGAPLFGEGLICLLMLAPIYLAITIVVAVLARALFRAASPAVRAGALIAPWLLFAVDRPVPVGELPIERVRDEVVLAVAPEDVVASIDHLELSIPPPPPGLLRWGLPIAQALHGKGIGVGDQRRLRNSARGSVRSAPEEAGGLPDQSRGACF
jgi:hypothetical protein